MIKSEGTVILYQTAIYYKLPNQEDEMDKGKTDGVVRGEPIYLINSDNFDGFPMAICRSNNQRVFER